MAQTDARWKRGDYFLLEAAEYQPEINRVRVRFRNRDLGEAPVEALWMGRMGRPDWTGIRIDSENRGALLVPTIPGYPASEGEIAEIPGDVIRAATDVDYRAHVARRAASWAKKTGRALTRLRQARKRTTEQVAQEAGVEVGLVTGIEAGRIEPSWAIVTRLLQALHASKEELWED